MPLFVPIRTLIAEALGARDPEVREALLGVRAVLDDISNAPGKGTE